MVRFFFLLVTFSLWVPLSHSFQGDAGVVKDDEKVNCKFNYECGYWWGFESKPDDEVAEEEVQIPLKNDVSEKEKKCGKKETWTQDCGFIDPEGDFEFMEIQRDALSKGMLMGSSNQKAVHAFQKFVKWAVDASTEAAHTWNYTMMQDQNVNPYVTHPVSRFGLKATLKLSNAKKNSIFDEIAEQGGILVYWSRSDCSWCHTMSESVLRVSEETGIPAFNLPLDGECLEGFSGDYCIETDETILEAARSLQVKYVPDLFLLLGGATAHPENWVRVSSGIEDRATIRNRIYTFFEGVRAATLAGASKAENAFGESRRPGVSFDTKSYSPNLNSSTKTIYGMEGNSK